MKGIFLSLVVVALVIAGGAALRSRGVTLSSIRLPGRSTEISKTADASSSGAVLGEETEVVKVNHFADRFVGVGKVIKNIAGALGTQVVKTGETLVKNVSSTPSTETEVIDVSEVVHDISSKVESIPGNLVKQAKVEYCRQVLLDATASASER